MTISASTGLKDAMLGSDGFCGTMNGAVFKLYSGLVPAHADDSIGGATLLCTISDATTPEDGVTFSPSGAGGVVTKLESDTWSGTNVASGTAKFYRLVHIADTGEASGVAPRLQGTVGLFNADLNLSSVNLVSGAPQSLTSYVVSLL